MSDEKEPLPFDHPGPTTPKGKRRPKLEDFPAMFELMKGGKSLRAACELLGVNPSDADDMIVADEGLRSQHAHARDRRGEHYQDRAIAAAEAAAKGEKFEGKDLDQQGVRTYVDTIKWAVGRMQPKGGAVQRVQIEYANMSDDDLEKAIAARVAETAESDDGESGEDQEPAAE